MLLSLLALPASAQTGSSSQPTNAQGQSGSSLGDYARQAKKDGAPAKARPKVFDNDNLPREDKLSVIGEARPATTAENSSENQPAQANGTAAPGDKPPAAPKSPEEEAAAKKAGGVAMSIPTCHVAMLQEPQKVADLITEAAKGSARAAAK